jgi:hypothetical protein
MDSEPQLGGRSMVRCQLERCTEQAFMSIVFKIRNTLLFHSFCETFSSGINLA